MVVSAVWCYIAWCVVVFDCCVVFGGCGWLMFVVVFVGLYVLGIVWC